MVKDEMHCFGRLFIIKRFVCTDGVGGGGGGSGGGGGGRVGES